MELRGAGSKQVAARTEEPGHVPGNFSRQANMEAQVLRSVVANFRSWAIRTVPVQAALSIVALMVSCLTARLELIGCVERSALRNSNQVKRFQVQKCRPG
jgi:hypothetical protein